MSNEMPQVGHNAAKLTDHEMGGRFTAAVGVARSKLLGSPLLIENPGKVSLPDLDRIANFLSVVSPVNPGVGTELEKWRLEQRTSFEPGQMTDGSSFGNWEEPGRVLDTTILATIVGAYLMRRIKETLREPDMQMSDITRRLISEFQDASQEHAAAVCATHDVGRILSQEQGAVDALQKRFFKNVGLRPDITNAHPDEQVMLAPCGRMEETIDSLSAYSLVCRLGDEFGKPNGEALYTLEDYIQWCEQGEGEQWALRYQERQKSGRPSTNYMHETLSSEILQRDYGIDLESEGMRHRIGSDSNKSKLYRTRLGVHVMNQLPYFNALSKRIGDVSSVSLQQLINEVGLLVSPSVGLEKIALSEKVNRVLVAEPPVTNA